MGAGPAEDVDEDARGPLERARGALRQARRRRSSNRRWLERFYAGAYDPYGFDTSPYEREKYADLLAAVGPGPYARGFEVGCSIGTFTEQLAPLCGSLLAVDIAQAAVDRTRQRTCELDNVQVERADFPRGLPPGPINVIVCSDVLYFVPVAALRICLADLEGLLAPGGRIVSLHFLGDFGAPTLGRQVHRLQSATWGNLEQALAVHRQDVGPGGAGYLLDVFVKPG